jgi:uncharacterized damage-inducible protein DinB
MLAAAMSDAALTYLRAGAYNNAWANQRLLAACAALDQAAFEARRVSFFPSLQRTLNHILTVDRYYVDALEGGTLGPAAWADDVPYPRFAELRTAQVEWDKRLIAVCDALTPATVGRPVQMIRTSRVQVDRADRVLLHLFQHQIHHRGQAHAMLSGTDVEPPQLDEFYMTGEAHKRADELNRLGTDERAVWGDLDVPR